VPRHLYADWRINRFGRAEDEQTTGNRQFFQKQRALEVIGAGSRSVSGTRSTKFRNSVSRHIDLVQSVRDRASQSGSLESGA
jgi:hypothetical protein